jgi:hypothetical protein
LWYPRFAITYFAKSVEVFRTSPGALKSAQTIARACFAADGRNIGLFERP